MDASSVVDGRSSLRSCRPWEWDYEKQEQVRSCDCVSAVALGSCTTAETYTCRRHTADVFRWFLPAKRHPWPASPGQMPENLLCKSEPIVLLNLVIRPARVGFRYTASLPAHKFMVLSSSRPQAFRYKNNCMR